MSIERPRFIYLRDPEDTQRVLTVSRKIDGDNMVFAYALCRPKHRGGLGDNFNRKVGRELAIERMNDPNRRTMIPLDTTDGLSAGIHKAVETYLQSLTEDNIYRVRNTVRRALNTSES